jgi:hypothetical protein
VLGLGAQHFPSPLARQRVGSAPSMLLPFCVCGMATWLAGRAASRQGVLGGGWTQLAATGWLVDTAAVQATVVHMDGRDSGILVGGVAVGGGMGVTAARC